MAQNRPAHTIRLGGISAAIWANQNGQNDVRFNVTITRLYKDDGDHWKDTTSLGRDDLPIVSKVADMAFEWIWNRAATSGSDSTSEK